MKKKKDKALEGGGDQDRLGIWAYPLKRYRAFNNDGDFDMSDDEAE